MNKRQARAAAYGHAVVLIESGLEDSLEHLGTPDECAKIRAALEELQHIWAQRAARMRAMDERKGKHDG